MATSDPTSYLPLPQAQFHVLVALTERTALGSAAAFYAQGASLATVAARFGVDPSTVANRFRRAGFTIRARRGWG